MSLREDNGPYCLIWLGMLLFGAYYANFAYQIYAFPTFAASFFAANIFPLMLTLLGLPPLMVFLFTGYLRPTRGKVKMNMLSFSVVAALFFVIFANLVSLNTDILGNLLIFSSWGIGSAVLTAGGFAIVQSYEQSTSPGMLDVSKLHYGPEPEPEPEPEVETPVEEASVEEPAPSEESESSTEEPEISSEEAKPEEPVSE